MLSNLPTIGARFDINKIDSGSYGFECWKVFWRAIPPSSIPGALLFEGDTAASCAGRENVYCIAVQSSDESAVERVRAALLQSSSFKEVSAQPMFVEGAGCVSEPLPDAGRIDHDGNLIGNAWNSRSALGEVKKETQPSPDLTKEVPDAPDRSKPASERTRDLPALTNFAELRKLVEDRFILRGMDFEYHYWMTPEELCDIAEQYAEMVEVQFSEYCCPLSEDLCCVRLFQKSPPEGRPIELQGLFPFPSESDVAEFLRGYKSAPRYTEALPKLAGIEGKYQLNFGKGTENSREFTYEKDKDIPPTSLWPRIHARRERFAADIRRHREEARRAAEEQRQRQEAEAKRRAEQDKRRAEEESLRREAEAKRRAEREQLEALQRQRKSQGQCIACGKPLGFIDRLLGRPKHSRCS